MRLFDNVTSDGNQGVDELFGIEFIQFSDVKVDIGAEIQGEFFPGTPGDDSITGTVAVDTIEGGEGDDTLEGINGNDEISGGAGNDILVGGAGDDTLDGGEGIDIARFRGFFDDYVITEDAVDGTVTVVDANPNDADDGTDILTNIRVLEFADKSIAFPNALPVGDAFSATTEEDTVIDIPVADLLAGDSDDDGDPLSIIGVTTDVGGTVSLINGGETVRFQPESNFNGSARFFYTLSDQPEGFIGFAEVEVPVTVDVTPVNDPPVARTDSFSITEDDTVSGNLLADNGNGIDFDVEDSPLTVTAINGVPLVDGAEITLPGGDLLTVGEDGSFAYDPNDAFDFLNTGSSSSQSFSYTVSDGDAESTASAFISISGITDAAIDVINVKGPALLDDLVGSSLTYTLTNPGDKPVTGTGTVGLYVSDDTVFGNGDDQLITTRAVDFDGKSPAGESTFAPGEAVNGTFSIPASLSRSLDFGAYTLFVLADITATDGGTDLADIGAATGTALRQPGYEADIEITTPDDRLFAVGETVSFTGSAISTADGTAVPLVPVRISVLRDGTIEQTFQVTTDSSGDFTFDYKAFLGSGGDYEITATHPDFADEPPAPEEDFSVLALNLQQRNIEVNTLGSLLSTGTLTLTNEGSSPITGLSFSVVELDEDGKFTGQAPQGGWAFDLPGLPDAIAGGQTISVPYQITSPNQVASQDFGLTILGDEGVADSANFFVEVGNSQPEIEGLPGQLTVGLVSGIERDEIIEFDIVNTGQSPAYNVTIELPGGEDFEWLTFIEGQKELDLGTIEGGEAVTLRLAADLHRDAADPDANGGDTNDDGVRDVELGVYFSPPGGGFVVEWETVPNSDGVSADEFDFTRLPFNFDVDSNATGNLDLRITDELTYFTEGAEPTVSDAVIRIIDNATGQQIARIDTDQEGQLANVMPNEEMDGADAINVTIDPDNEGQQGEILVENLPEGNYSITITSEDHTTYNNNFSIGGSSTTSFEAFMPLEIVTYNWTVTPTQVEDRLRITVETEFETDVPLPVVVMEPPVLEIADMEPGEEQIIDVTVTNHGFISVQDVVLDYPSPPGYVVVPATNLLPELGAQTVETIPVFVRKLEPDEEPGDVFDVNTHFPDRPDLPFPNTPFSDDPGSPGGGTGCQPSISYRYECGPHTNYRWDAVAYDVPCGPVGGGGVGTTGGGGGGGVGGGGGGIIQPTGWNILPGRSTPRERPDPEPGVNYRPKPEEKFQPDPCGPANPGDPDGPGGEGVPVGPGEDPLPCWLPIAVKAGGGLLAAAALGSSLPFAVTGVLAGSALAAAGDFVLSGGLSGNPSGGASAAASTMAQGVGTSIASGILSDFADSPSLGGATLGTLAKGLFGAFATGLIVGDLIGDIADCVSSGGTIPAGGFSDSLLGSGSEDVIGQVLSESNAAGKEEMAEDDDCGCAAAAAAAVAAAQEDGTIYDTSLPAPETLGFNAGVLNEDGVDLDHVESILGTRFDGLLDVQEYSIRMLNYLDYLEYYIGDLAVFDTLDGEALEDFFNDVADAYGAANIAIEAGQFAPRIVADPPPTDPADPQTYTFTNSAGQQVPLRVPDDWSQGVLEDFVARFNRTMDYWDQGKTTLDDLSAGESTDFLAMDVLIELQERITGPLLAEGSSFDNPVLADPGIAEDIAAYDQSVFNNVLEFQSELLIEQQKQIDGVCATIRLRVEQDVVMSRDAFLGSLIIETFDNHGISDVDLDIVIYDSEGVEVNDAGVFGASPTFLSTNNVSSLSPTNNAALLDGEVDLSTNDELTAEFTFVPTLLAAQDGPETYSIGGSLSYIDESSGERINITLDPVSVDVLPQPEIQLRYFWERDAIGDDPFTNDLDLTTTDDIEESVPFALGVQVVNVGAGNADDFRIESKQPEIIDNEKGLFVDFEIVESQVDDQQVQSDRLVIDFGTLEANSSRTGVWFLESSLQGKFIEYEARFTHLNPLGLASISSINAGEAALPADQEEGQGEIVQPELEALSLVTDVVIHELIRASDFNGDGIVDFFANDLASPIDGTPLGGPLLNFDTPDTLYFSGEVVTNADAGLNVELALIETTGNEFYRGPAVISVPRDEDGNGVNDVGIVPRQGEPLRYDLFIPKDDDGSPILTPLEWGYINVLFNMPFGFEIADIQRASDGSSLLEGQYWTTDRTFSNLRVRPTVEDRLHIAADDLSDLIVVLEPSDDSAPVALDDALTTDERTLLSTSLFADNGGGSDFDLENDPFVVDVYGKDATPAGTPVALPQGGMVTIDADGNLTFDPNGDFDFLADGQSEEVTFNYRIKDAANGLSAPESVGSVTIIVAGLEEGIGLNDSFEVDEDVLLEDADMAENDSTVVGVFEPVTVTKINGVDIPAGESVVNLPSGAILTVNSDGTFDYDQNGTFELLNDGETDTDSFTYDIVDKFGLTGSATVTITINGVTDAPLLDAVDDNPAGTDEDTATIVDVLANDLPDSGLTISRIDGTAIGEGEWRELAGGGKGKLDFDLGRTVIFFDPAGDFDALDQDEIGAPVTFTYTVTDGTDEDSATVTIPMTGVNDAPVAVDDDGGTTPFNTPAVINVRINDFDPDAGDDLASLDVGVDGSTALGGSVVVDPLTQEITYTPPILLTGGGTDSFSYTLTDPLGAQDTALVTITVEAATLPPATDGDDRIRGDGSDEIIDGLAGDDLIRGGGGNDTLIGGLGEDNVRGENGDDLLIYDARDPAELSDFDVIDGGAGSDTLLIELTAAQWGNGASDIAQALEAFVDSGFERTLFDTATLNLGVDNVEALQVSVDGVLQLDPFA